VLIARQRTSARIFDLLPAGRGLVWVRSQHSGRFAWCPLYPRKRTLFSATRMLPSAKSAVISGQSKFLQVFDSFREERLSDANQFAAALADIQRVNSFECLDNDPIAWNAPQFGVILQHIRSTYRRRAKRRHD
jgi:hypothetical protein